MWVGSSLVRKTLQRFGRVTRPNLNISGDSFPASASKRPKKRLQLGLPQDILPANSLSFCPHGSRDAAFQLGVATLEWAYVIRVDQTP